MAALLEIAAAEWGADPVRITERWSDELLILMVDKLCERRRRENEDAERARKRAGRAKPGHPKLMVE
jgi:hypothetical protein